MAALYPPERVKIRKLSEGEAVVSMADAERLGVEGIRDLLGDPDATVWAMCEDGLLRELTGDRVEDMHWLFWRTMRDTEGDE